MKSRLGMKCPFCLILFAGLLAGLAAAQRGNAQQAPIIAASGVDVNDTRLLSRPAISANNIAFVYAGDLWVAGIDGKNARRLIIGRRGSGVPAPHQVAAKPQGMGRVIELCAVDLQVGQHLFHIVARFIKAQHFDPIDGVNAALARIANL